MKAETKFIRQIQKLSEDEDSRKLKKRITELNAVHHEIRNSYDKHILEMMAGYVPKNISGTSLDIHLRAVAIFLCPICHLPKNVFA